jgi:hypothetical protein
MLSSCFYFYPISQGEVVHVVLSMLLLSKSMVVVLKETDTLRAESKSDGRTVTVALGVVSKTKHRVCCVSVHGCTTPYVDLGTRGGEGSGRTERGSSFTDVMTSTTSAVVSHLHCISSFLQKFLTACLLFLLVLSRRVLWWEQCQPCPA